jgi:hypothetical protein
MVDARGLVRLVAHLADAADPIIGRLTPPAKLKSTSRGLFARHMVASVALLDTLPAFWALLDTCTLLQRLQERNFFASCSVLVVLGARAVLVPLATMREACLALALEARHDWKRVLRRM